ncbi:hypothetical protein GCM10023084_79560 [Streptomyces lacrimifluminis]|uniref:Uncharacterized protein n=1 Tax=Streptomyces lacrimifluminis TaxID=1500077 RepID=A0A917UNA8_9ACTN|nr:CRISPR-associated endonuclease Cas2 [Streptomyces lacrimifluminis]GGJ70004.1 hypothetical protein GCM10012282_78590 [Streptomyces lacrimifluminis]
MPYTLLVSYDIADDDRRGKIFDLLAAQGARVQYSVKPALLDHEGVYASRSGRVPCSFHISPHCRSVPQTLATKCACWPDVTSR